jgi:hypothetical protein
MPRRRSKFTQYDLARAARAAHALGHGHLVRVTPDGSIWLLPPDVALSSTTAAPAAPPASPPQPATPLERWRATRGQD